MNALAKLSNVKKLIVFILSSALEAVNEGLVPAQYVHYVQLTVFFLTAIGLYAARNTPPAAAEPGAHSAPDAGLDVVLPADLPPVPAG